jgi:hypothetical protein
MKEEKEETESTTQKLQNKVDKLKLLNLTSNIHNLTPPQKSEDDPTRDIQLVKALSVIPRIAMIFLEIRGLEYDVKTKQYVQVTEPIMNVLGAYRFCKVLKNIAQETEWASFSEDEINSRIIHHFEENIPYFLFWAEDYELNPRDFNYVISTLQSFIDSCFHKAKSGKYINTLGRTYGEDILKKALDTEGNISKKKEGGFLEKYNPFKER